MKWTNKNLARTMAASTMIAAIFHAEPVKADFISGNELYEQCTSNELDEDYVVNIAMCIGYVKGAVDGIYTGNVFGHVLSENNEVENLICSPDGVKFEQYIDIVTKYIKENPSERHRGASTLVAAAFLSVWSCDRGHE